jgi:hypothetical protein
LIFEVQILILSIQRTFLGILILILNESPACISYTLKGERDIISELAKSASYGWKG